MPGSATHRYLHYQAGKILLPVSMVVGYSVCGVYGSVVCGAGYIFHRWCDQDLDEISITKLEAEYAAIIVLAPIVGYTTLYAALIKFLPPIFGFPRGHRSFWSHFPPVGAPLRLLFFTVPLYVLLWKYIPHDLTVEFLCFSFGLQLADWVHSIADWIDSSKSNFFLIKSLRNRLKLLRAKLERKKYG